ncbi:unnamed protein product (macronuclear) [Paramecium tetraurelia]|uniref:Uncharacterized protein n=1 Tax=Paramecium tetraurelia TaxID=5888 RepID=A0CAZ2_PARTE|nr:uncharacterized protein GSPATT00036742001 [Paramecium tetraurelia]CAK67959.1 unnamed protein product [Paramecium tetraurelia]|eukprot:XP_001435356.1 hypothetical protein (macronuclear) [Paramecium tetraurelia strain d4-2]
MQGISTQCIFLIKFPVYMHHIKQLSQISLLFSVSIKFLKVVVYTSTNTYRMLDIIIYLRSESFEFYNESQEMQNIKIHQFQEFQQIEFRYASRVIVASIVVQEQYKYKIFQDKRNSYYVQHHSHQDVMNLHPILNLHFKCDKRPKFPACKNQLFRQEKKSNIQKYSLTIIAQFVAKQLHFTTKTILLLLNQFQQETQLTTQLYIEITISSISSHEYDLCSQQVIFVILQDNINKLNFKLNTMQTRVTKQLQQTINGLLLSKLSSSQSSNVKNLDKIIHARQMTARSQNCSIVLRNEIWQIVQHFVIGKSQNAVQEYLQNCQIRRSNINKLQHRIVQHRNDIGMLESYIFSSVVQ